MRKPSGWASPRQSLFQIREIPSSSGYAFCQLQTARHNVFQFLLQDTQSGGCKPRHNFFQFLFQDTRHKFFQFFFRIRAIISSNSRILPGANCATINSNSFFRMRRLAVANRAIFLPDPRNSFFRIRSLSVADRAIKSFKSAPHLN